MDAKEGNDLDMHIIMSASLRLMLLEVKEKDWNTKLCKKKVNK